MELPDNVMRLLNDRKAEKTLTTVTDNGKTSVTSVKALKAPKPNVIVLAQIKAPQLNKALLRHMTQGSLVSILCVSVEDEKRIVCQIVCSVNEFQTSGPLYEKLLDELRARYIDLEGVWVLEPVDVVARSNDFEHESAAT